MAIEGDQQFSDYAPGGRVVGNSGDRGPAIDQAVGYTATIVAAKRVLEQYNPQPLVWDPYGERLVGAECQHLLERWEAVAQRQQVSLGDVIAKRTRYVAVRTRFFDDLITTFCHLHGDSQVVLLGSGLDTRGFRLGALASARVYEVEQVEVLDQKRQGLQGLQPIAAQYHALAGDLTEVDRWRSALLQAGFQPHRATFWLLEGVVMYLRETAAIALIQGLAALSRPGSQLALDGVRRGSIAAAQDLRQQGRGRVVRHWQFGCDRPQSWLQAQGWLAQVWRPSGLGFAADRYPPHLPESPALGDQGHDRGVWLAQAQWHPPS